MLDDLLMMVLLCLLPSLAVAADAELWRVERSGPGSEYHCPENAAKAVANHSPGAKLLNLEKRVRWEGGSFPLHKRAGQDEDIERPDGNCFALVVDGKIIAAGAFIWFASAQALPFPVIQIIARKPGEVQEFVLLPRSLGGTVPQLWKEVLPDLR